MFVVCALKHKKDGNKVKRVQVTFTEEQWNIIERLRGVMGSDDAEIVRNIVLAWLSEKSVVAETAKKKMREGKEK
jgi:aryl-alcohol dehydrogenase-like predicted oxidoreductase